MMKHWYRVVLLVLVLLSACASPEAVPETGEAQSAPFVSPIFPISPLPEPTVVSPLPSPEPGEDSEAVIAFLLPLLAERLDVDVKALTVVEIAPVSWSDTSLGCPQPGMMYAQMITPGWQVIVEDQGGRRYDVRTSGDPRAFVICEEDTAAGSLPPREADEAVEAIAAAKALLAERRELDPDLLEVVSVDAVEWPDGCLGCPAPGTSCTEAVVPGYRIRFRSGDARYEVHTDLIGGAAVLCEGVE